MGYIKEEPELNSEDEAEIEAWVEHELTTGDKTITKKEAGDAIAAFAKKKGFKLTKEDWAALEAAFDSVDTNGDGELDLDEDMAAVEAHSDIKIPKTFFKKYMKAPELDSEDEEEIEAWVEHELTTGDKTITKKEAGKAIAAFAKKKGYKISKEEWAALEAAFDAADTNGDGELDLDEVQAAVAAEEEIKIPYKKYFKRFLRTKDEPEMSEEEEDEVKAWAEKELADGGTITGPEAIDFFGKYAKKHHYKMTPMDWGYLGYMFGQADTNSDGELDAAEVQAAMGEDA